MNMLSLLAGLPTPALLGILAVGAFGLAVALFRVAERLGRSTGLDSNAKVLASDTGQNRLARLADESLRLRGQPDYVLQERVGVLRRRKIVPVEIKPTRKRQTLYEGDEMQLVVYMLLARRTVGRRFAGYGYVRYRDCTFKVKLTREREARCLAYADLVREARKLGHYDIDSPPLPCRCGRCP